MLPPPLVVVMNPGPFQPFPAWTQHRTRPLGTGLLLWSHKRHYQPEPMTHRRNSCIPEELCKYQKSTFLHFTNVPSFHDLKHCSPVKKEAHTQATLVVITPQAIKAPGWAGRPLLVWSVAYSQQGAGDQDGKVDTRKSDLDLLNYVILTDMDAWRWKQIQMSLSTLHSALVWTEAYRSVAR